MYYGNVCNQRISQIKSRSNWLKQYWNGVDPAIQYFISDFCYQSHNKNIIGNDNRVRAPEKRSNPNRYCKKVGDILTQFQFTEISDKQTQKDTLLKVGLVAYCGACECCNQN